MRAFKWIGIVLGGLVVIVMILLAYSYFSFEQRRNRIYDIQVSAVSVPAFAPTEQVGWPLALVDICKDCHGDNFAGQVLEDDLFGRLVSRNLTGGRGGIPSTYTDTDWVRSIRHGVRPDGKPLLIMPVQEFWYLSDTDVGQIVAYLKSQPPVDNVPPPMTISPIGRLFVTAGLLPGAIPAEDVDHTTRPPAPPRGVTVEYGEYMAFVCKLCHGTDMSGGENVSAGINITPGGDVGQWTEAQFIQTIRTGVRPDGEELDPEEMPWESIAKLTDNELSAIWLYLRSVPAVETLAAP